MGSTPLGIKWNEETGEFSGDYHPTDLSDDDAAGTPILPSDPRWKTLWPTGMRLFVGTQQGTHSGYEDCIMRYDCANAFISGQIVYRIPHEKGFYSEVSGTSLCTDPKGTGVNDPAHKPRIRYGDAAAGRGDCKHKLCVNDRYH